jgi:hypothetical protein
MNVRLELRLAVIASEAKQSISPRKGRMDCFASLAMTVSGPPVIGCLKIESSRGSDPSGLTFWLGVAATVARSLSYSSRRQKKRSSIL